MWSDAVERFLGEFVLPFVPRLLTALVVLAVLFGLAYFARGAIRRFGETRGLDKDLSQILATSASVVLRLLGGIMALGTLGIDVTALVASLGLTGFALGFALKDIISNALAGFLLLLYEPFHREDQVTVAGFQGIVKQITLRYTILDAEGKQVFVPNSLLFSNAVTVVRHDGNATATG